MVLFLRSAPGSFFLYFVSFEQHLVVIRLLALSFVRLFFHSFGMIILETCIVIFILGVSFFFVERKFVLKTKFAIS